MTTNHGRTASDWLALRATESYEARAEDHIVPTGIRALDLFAPLHRGGVQHWPPAVGVGQTVLLYAVAQALRPAEFWLIGFEHGPYSEAGAEHEAKETGVQPTIRLAAAGHDPAARRTRFGVALAECLHRNVEPARRVPERTRTHA